MEFIACTFFCFVVIVLIFLPHTFGNWNRKEGLPIIEPGIKMSCVDWITFYGFKTDDFIYNKNWAIQRDFTLDLDISTWAAMYAYALTGSFYEGKFLPEDLCFEHSTLDFQYPFLALQDVKLNCEDWIYLYGYSPDDDALNRSKAIRRNTNMDEYIAIWADGYARFICKKTLQIYTLPSEYCRGIGKTRQHDLMPFVDRKGSLFSCEGWNDLYDYTADDLQNNYFKAIHILDDARYTYHIHIK